MSSISTRRKTISDNLITNDIFMKLLNYTLSKVNDPDNISQMEVVKILLEKKLSNTTIAKIINVLLSDAKATQGSVASLVHHIRNKNDLLDELLKDIGGDF